MENRLKLVGITETHDDIGLDVIRIFLGIALLIRGGLFMADQSRVMAMVQQQDIDWIVPIMLIHAVTLAHLLGGLMLAAGLFTRLAALIQMPVLIIAVFFAFLQGGLLMPAQSLELSALVLFLLAVFLIFGPGTLSLDELIFARGSGVEVGEQITEEEREARIRERVERQRQEKLEAAERETQRLSQQPAEVPASAPVTVDHRARWLRVFKYALVGVAGISLFLLGITNLPPDISANEVGAIAGVVIFVFAAFLLFYRSAFRD